MQTSGRTSELRELKELAKKATSKLEWEGRQKERCLRRVVLTANMIDGLADEIDGLKTRAKPQAETSCHIEMVGWADKVSEGLAALEQQRDVVVEDDDDIDSDSDSDSDSVSSDDLEEATTPRRLSEEDVHFSVHECAVDDGDDEDDYDWARGEVTDLSLKLFPTGFLGQHNGHGPESKIVVTELESDPLLDAVDQAMIDQT